MTTKVPVIRIREGDGLRLCCEWCGECVEPRREFLSEYRDLRYEGAACPKCGKQIAGLVVELLRNRRAGDKGG